MNNKEKLLNVKNFLSPYNENKYLRLYLFVTYLFRFNPSNIKGFLFALTIVSFSCNKILTIIFYYAFNYFLINIQTEKK